MPTLFLPQGTRAGQCQTLSICRASELPRETYLSWGEGHHRWGVGVEGRRKREIRNKDAVSKHQEIQSTFTPEIQTEDGMMNLPHFPKLIARRRQEDMARSRALHVLMSVLLLHTVFLQMPLACPLFDKIHLNHPEANTCWAPQSLLYS